ncbi:MAG: acyltransferase family protein [Nocardioides sp.]|jgi:fucose 4-O-acetylase-like acetyltransferase
MPGATRDPWLDNAKMALVTLVVIGHAWTLLPQTTLNNHVYDFLYAWHIPAFVFVTGYLSRGFTYTQQRFWQLFRTVVVPYLIFECAFALFRVHVGGEKLEDLFADPHWPLWYLSALFFWRLMTPIFKPMWGGVAVAIVISLLAGLWLGDTLDLARVFGLLPFFVLGLKATPEHLEPLRARWVKIAAVPVFVGIFVLTRFTDQLAATEWLYYRSRYEEMDVSDAEAVVIRLVVLAVGALGTFAFLALVPRVGGWFARMGAYTLVVYLFHGFVIKGVSYTGFPGWAIDHPDLSLLLTTIGGLLLALLLAWRPLASRLQDVVDPFGYAERHARHAVAITAVVSEDEPDGPRMPSGGVSG